MENGLTEQKIEQLDTGGESFTPRERLAVEYAERLAVDFQLVQQGRGW